MAKSARSRHPAMENPELAVRNRGVSAKRNRSAADVHTGRGHKVTWTITNLADFDAALVVRCDPGETPYPFSDLEKTWVIGSGETRSFKRRITRDKAAEGRVYKYSVSWLLTSGDTGVLDPDIEIDQPA